MSCRRHKRLSGSGSSKRIIIPSGSIDPNRPSVIEIPLVRTNDYTISDQSRQYDNSLHASRNFITPAATPPAPVPQQPNLCTSCGQDHSMMGNLNRTMPNYPPSSTPIRGNPNVPPPNVSMVVPQYRASISNNSSYYQSAVVPNQQRFYQQSQNYTATPISNYHSVSCPMNQSMNQSRSLCQYQQQPRPALSPYFKSPDNGNLTKQEISDLIDEKFKVLMTAINNQNNQILNNQNHNSGQGATESNPVKRKLFAETSVKHNDDEVEEEACNNRTCDSCIMKMKDGASKKKN